MNLLRRCVARLAGVRVEDRDRVISFVRLKHPTATHVRGYWIPDGTFIVYTEHLVDDVSVSSETL